MKRSDIVVGKIYEAKGPRSSYRGTPVVVLDTDGYNRAFRYSRQAVPAVTGGRGLLVIELPSKTEETEWTSTQVFEAKMRGKGTYCATNMIHDTWTPRAEQNRKNREIAEFSALIDEAHKINNKLYHSEIRSRAQVLNIQDEIEPAYSGGYIVPTHILARLLSAAVWPGLIDVATGKMIEEN